MAIWPMNELFLDATTPPSLRGQACAACSEVSFPPNPHGCETCGATASELSEFPLAGRGRLRAFATTYLPPRKDVDAPFTVAVIALEAGPVIRALMVDPTAEALKVGDAVRARIVTGGDGARQLRFELTEAA